MALAAVLTPLQPAPHSPQSTPRSPPRSQISKQSPKTAAQAAVSAGCLCQPSSLSSFGDLGLLRPAKGWAETRTAAPLARVSVIQGCSDV